MDGDYAAAESEFKKALAIDPRIYHSWKGLAKVCLKTSRFSEAEEDCRKAIGLYSYDEEARRMLEAIEQIRSEKGSVS